jgi:pimeloyl-ACP methyl ester carboxylesterase
MTWHGMLGLSVAALLASGCADGFYVDTIVKPNVQKGRVRLDLKGTGPQLVQRGQIERHERIDTSRGVTIDVWLMRGEHVEDGNIPRRGTFIPLHGLQKSKAYHWRTSELLAREGFDVVLMDLRAHGRSTGRYTTYGFHEKQDVKDVMDYLTDAGLVEPPFYVFGETLGATTAIQYAAIDDRVAGVVADSPYKDFRSQARRMIQPFNPGISDEDFNEVVRRCARVADFDPNEASSVKPAGEIDSPLLLLRGLGDITVPLEDIRAVLHAAQGPKQLKTLDLMTVFAYGENWLAERVVELQQHGLRGD